MADLTRCLDPEHNYMLAGKCIVSNLSKALYRTFEKDVVVSSQCLGHRVRFIHHLYLQPEIAKL